MWAPTIDPALAELCRREHVRLVGLLSLYTGDRAVGEDLAQEVLLRAHQLVERRLLRASYFVVPPPAAPIPTPFPF